MFNEPSGDSIRGATKEVLKHAILAAADAYWLRGSFDAPVEWYEPGVVATSYPESALTSRILLLPLSDPELKFVVMAEPRGEERLFPSSRARSTGIVSPTPGGQPWESYSHHSIGRAVVWVLLDRLYEGGDVPDAPEGYEWIAESDVTLPGTDRPPNEGMKLTKPERIGASQLMPGVRRTQWCGVRAEGGQDEERR